MLKNLTDFLGAAVTIYMFLIIIRIMMTWFSPSQSNDPKRVIPRLTDPYLNFFKSMGFSFGHVDFSPLVAITLLVIISNILAQIGIYGKITLGIFLTVIVSAVWNAASSLLFFLFIIAVIRLVILLIKYNTFSPILSSIDAMLVPMAKKAASLFIKSDISGYQTNLMILSALLIGFYYIGNFAVSILAGILIKMPF